MIYTSPTQERDLTVITYGSHLYGTNTATSDHDFKVIYMPSLESLLLAKELKVLRYRWDKDGEPVGDSVSMGDNGHEAEHTPFHKFANDWLRGQSYAVEVVYAVLAGAHESQMGPPATRESRNWHLFHRFCSTLAMDFAHRNMTGMAAFARKQTMDYVHRGERLNKAKEVKAWLENMLSNMLACGGGVRADLCRLDSQRVFMENDVIVKPTVLDLVAKHCKLEIGSSVSREVATRTMVLNGREYLETSTLPNMIGALDKLITNYGERSWKAAETAVDWKSLMHAVRVYQQVIEFFETGSIEFPRPNAEFLLKIRNKEFAIESVRDLLAELELRAEEMMEDSDLPDVDDQMRADMDSMVLSFVNTFYER